MHRKSPDIFPPIPKVTANAAKSVFGRNNFYLVIGDQVNELFSGLVLSNPYRAFRQSERTAAMLHLITVFQSIETLPDCQAADALRKRVDWKYALHLPLDYPGMDSLVFCEFRKDLLAYISDFDNLNCLLLRLSEIAPFTGKREISLHASDVIHELCFQNRLAIVLDSIRKVLGALAVKKPQWLSYIALPYWYERYSQQRNTFVFPPNVSQQEEYATAIGRDGLYVMDAVSKSNISGLETLSEVTVLKQIWNDQYLYAEGKIAWRKDTCAKCTSTVLA